MKWQKQGAGRSLRLVISALTVLAAQQAFAVGTPAGDIVSNTASVDYQVGGVSQDRIDSAPVTFTVDRLVDFTLTVTDAASSPVTPGGTGTIASLLLTNIGNATQDFNLSAVNIVGGSVNGIADAFEMDTPIEVYADLDGSGDLSAGDTPYVDELSDDPTGSANQVQLIIVADAPSTPTPANGTGSTVELTVTAYTGLDSGNAGTPITGSGSNAIDGEDIVLATDVITVQDGFVISAADISVTKVPTVIEDPVNGTVSPFAIPGATIEYSITATNTGSEDATGVGFIDDISSLPVTLATGGYAGGVDAEVEQNSVVVLSCTLDADDLSDGDGCGLFGTEVRILPAALTLDTSGGPLSSAVARFRVTID